MKARGWSMSHFRERTDFSCSVLIGPLVNSASDNKGQAAHTRSVDSRAVTDC